MLMRCKKNLKNCETQKAPFRRTIMQKLRRLVDQSMTADIPLQSVGTAGETLYNHSDEKGSTNGC